ncbi:MAG: hypothetical protein M3R24_41615 [Chloroflexota bacterium]|nr:hypothetical protein [Chloroflexota bacterium]
MDVLMVNAAGPEADGPTDADVESFEQFAVEWDAIAGILELCQATLEAERVLRQSWDPAATHAIERLTATRTRVVTELELKLELVPETQTR